MDFPKDKPTDAEMARMTQWKERSLSSLLELSEQEQCTAVTLLLVRWIEHHYPITNCDPMERVTFVSQIASSVLGSIVTPADGRMPVLNITTIDPMGSELDELMSRASGSADMFFSDRKPPKRGH